VIDQDSLKIVLEQGDLNIPVSLIKSSRIPMVKLEDNLRKVVDEMIKLGADYVVVVDEEDKYAGVILAEDIVAAISYYIVGLPSSEE